MWINSISNVLFYPFILSSFIMRYGFIGIPISMVLNYWMPAILLIAYMVKYKENLHYEIIYSQKNFEFNSNSLFVFLKDCIPGILSMGEWYFWEISALIVSTISKEVLAANSIIITMCSFCYMIWEGVGLALISRIGNLIGSS